MTRNKSQALSLLALAFAFAICLFVAWTGPSSDGQASEVASCADVHCLDGWCDSCSVGFIAGTEVSSKLVFDALDAHGHEYESESIDCESCQEAITTSDYCLDCSRGYWEGKAYFSVLSYQIAKAERGVEPGCAGCKAAVDEARWCSECLCGRIGDVSIRNRDDFEKAAGAFMVLRKALEEVQRCELCAASMAIDGTCPRCKIAYRRGHARPLER
ncbi:MAG: hypothetical protein CMJ89_04615 [Planctomycetes bacterium]|nr:hypothetical protein [Planctomycetota bacterium]